MKFNYQKKKKVDDFQFCLSCYFLNLEFCPNILKLLCCLNQLYCYADTIVKCFHECRMNQMSQLRIYRQEWGVRGEEGLQN